MGHLGNCCRPSKQPHMRASFHAAAPNWFQRTGTRPPSIECLASASPSCQTQWVHQCSLLPATDSESSSVNEWYHTVLCEISSFAHSSYFIFVALLHLLLVYPPTNVQHYSHSKILDISTGASVHRSQESSRVKLQTVRAVQYSTPMYWAEEQQNPRLLQVASRRSDN
jgi:hypothetical protein